MKAQYNKIKEQYPDCLLFFRLGDFYEMFDEDAVLVSEEIGLTLTTRDRGKPEDERTPMCGVPYHACESYIQKLIAKGHRIAICEQLEDPALAKGIVTRDVIRIVTPGTLTEASMLDEKKSNYLAAVFYGENAGAAAFSDISTGEFCVSVFDKYAISHMLSELARFSPSEVILSSGAEKTREIPEFCAKRLGALCSVLPDSFEEKAAGEALCSLFKADSPQALGLNSPAAVCASGALLSYIILTQKQDPAYIKEIEIMGSEKYMELDYSAIRSLELLSNTRTGDKKGSLLGVLDKTKTPMGARLLRSWISRPLLSPVAISKRLDAVSELREDSVKRGEIISCLKAIGDIKRLSTKASAKTANGRDLRALGRYFEALPPLMKLLSDAKSDALKKIAKTDTLSALAELLGRAIDEDCPLTVREGGIIKTGYNAEVDELRSLRDHGADAVRKMESDEREKTGIKKLKISYNRVFGYYIDVPNSAGDVALPDNYIRKQTLVSSERYFTPELKELENALLSAADKLSSLEYRLFTEIMNIVSEKNDEITATADTVAELDCYASLAEVAAKNNYVRPEVDFGSEIRIVAGRHPVVEAASEDSAFVPNDTYLNDSGDIVAIITGPNMAGKSTYMRQTALIVLMAQMGSFVPARSAVIGAVDRVFTRIGASDDIATGQSTFMVEMTEAAEILRHATRRSLIILDEIGRGTSTYDGMAIARAILEYCADRKKLGAKTMFATHYHELSALEGTLPGVCNYNITAKKQAGRLIFLRKIIRGAADHSYGVEVAKLAGLPDIVVSKAGQFLKELEASSAAPHIEKNEDDGQISLLEIGNDSIRRELRAVDPNNLTPLDAMKLIYELKALAEA